MTAALADDFGHLLLAVVEALDKVAIAGRFFDGVEVGALDVLDDGEFEDFLVVEAADDDRHRVQARTLGGAPAAFAGDDLIHLLVVGIDTDDDRLDETLGADRLGEFCQFIFTEILARVEAAAAQLIRADQTLFALRGAARRDARGIANQRCETTAKTALLQGHVHRSLHLCKGQQSIVVTPLNHVQPTRGYKTRDLNFKPLSSAARAQSFRWRAGCRLGCRRNRNRKAGSACRAMALRPRACCAG